MIYAPWDVLSYIKDLQNNSEALPNNYWANTSSNDVIRKLIDRTNASISNDYSSLINGENISKQITENLTYNDLYTEENNIWSLMLETGYLTLSDRFQPNGETLIRIPNEEIRQLFISTVNKWFSDSIKEENLSPLFSAIWTRDQRQIEKSINRYLARSISYYDYSESFYHVFLVGLFSARGFAVKSNLESGLGRPDIVLLDNKNSRAAIFEIKQARKEDEIESKKSEALSQIKEKDYKKSFEEYDTILQYSIIFHRKKAFVTSIEETAF